MPFGKYEGIPVDRLPIDYLKWLYTTNLYGELKNEVFEILHRGRSPTTSCITTNLVKIHEIYKQLAKKWHPDHGGNNYAMAAITDFYQAVKKTMEEPPP